MKQCLHLARALVAGPPLILLDEPTRSLDAATTAAVQALIREAAAQSIVLFSTHDEEERRRLATREIRLPGVGHA